MTGLAYGLVFSIRPGILPLVVILTVLSVVYQQLTNGHLSRLWQQGSSPLMLPLQSVVIMALAWGGLVAFWPWAHENPFGNPIQAMLLAKIFHVFYPVLFEGTMHGSNSLLWHYLPKMIPLSISVPILVLAGKGVTDSLQAITGSPQKPSSTVLFIKLCWVFVPILVTVMLRPNIYDGMRHSLFLLPDIASLAGLGASRLENSARRFFPRALTLTGIIAALCLSIPQMVRLNPYQYCYYILAGGLTGATGKYETDFWVTSYKEAAEWINNTNGPVKVLVAADDLNSPCFRYFLKSSAQATSVFAVNFDGAVPPPFDYYIATTRYGMHANFPKARVVHKIGRDGAIFTIIKRNMAE